MDSDVTGPTGDQVVRPTAPDAPTATVSSEFVGDLLFENEYPTDITPTA